MPPARIYKEKDANKNVLKGKTLAIIGYGSQGSAHALNLKDSGFKVLVGLRVKSRSAELARKRGLKVVSIAEAVKLADIIMLAIPDMEQSEVYKNEIEPNLESGKTLVFLHGLAVAGGLISLRDDINVIMVAPKGPGKAVRSQYLDKRGVPALIAVERGGREAKAIALAWADAIGSTRAGVIETTFKEELETDLFGEQAVLCGGLTSLIRAGFETLVEAGYKPEMAYFECCHELKLIADLIIQGGISGMRSSVSDTAKYGDVSRGSRVISSSTKREMKKILKEIQSGKFVKEWEDEYKGGLKKYNKLLAEGKSCSMERVGQRLRSLMPWSAKHNIKGAQASYSSVSEK